jgi:dUTPase
MARAGVLTSVEILNVALLRLRVRPRCGLALNHNLPFLNEQT